MLPVHRRLFQSAFVVPLVAAAVFAGGVAGAAPGKPAPPPPSAGASLPGAGQAPGGFASWADLMRAQDRLDAAAGRITRLRDSALAGIVVSAETRQLTVYWKGRPTAVARRAGSPGGDLTVRFLAAHYSQHELLGAVNRVIRRSGVSAAAPKADGSGITVSLRPAPTGASGAGLTAAVEQVRAAAGVPVQADTAAPQPASRGNDSPPYWGGARWNGCSTGFAILVGGTTKMLSAGHCADNGNAAYDGGGDYMGTVSGDNNSYDRLYINVSSAGRVWDGGVGSGEFTKPVVGADHSYVGNLLCTSGAYSGARCNIQVKVVNETINIGYLVYQTVRAEQVDHQNAIGNGDSGGPVFSLSSDPSKVIAKGTNTAIDTTTAVACTGIPAGGGRSCAWRMWYVDVVNSLNAYGASIVTG